MPFEPWTTLSDEVAFENRWVQVRIQRVRLPSGAEYDYSIVDRPAQGVGIILADEGGRVLFEQEYRHGIEQVVWQFPGGLIDEDETPLQSAQRELLEETGYRATEWHDLGLFYDNPALGNASSRLFLARHPSQNDQTAWDHAEAVELQWKSLKWVREAITRGEIVDRVVLSAIAMLWAHGLLSE